MAMPTTLPQLQQMLSQEIISNINVMLQDVSPENQLDRRIVAKLESHLNETLSGATQAIVTPALSILREENRSMLLRMDAQVIQVQTTAAETSTRLEAAVAELIKIRTAAETLDGQMAARQGEVAALMTSADLKLKELKDTQDTRQVAIESKLEASFNAAQEKFKDHSKQVVNHCEQQLSQIRMDVDRTIASSGGSSGGSASHKGKGLMGPKDCPVDKISLTTSKGDFGYWVKTVTNFLESHQGWRGATQVLKSARRCKSEITADVFIGCTQEINSTRTQGMPPLHLSDWTSLSIEGR